MAKVMFLPLPEWGHIEPTLPIARGLAKRGHTVVYCLEDSSFAEPLLARGFESISPFESIWPRGYRALRPIYRVSNGNYPPRDADEARRSEQAARWVSEGHLHDLLVELGVEVCFVDYVHKILIEDLSARGMRVVRVHTAVMSTRPDERWYTPSPDIPEVVLWPSPLRRETNQLPMRIFAGCLIDDDRPRTSFPWARLTAGKPLVYVSFGTQTARHRETPDVLRKCIEAARERSEWDVVVVAGSLAAQLDELAPPHVVVVERAPQTEVLARANVFVTHCGAGSIKESVRAGVPMVALPLAFDQPYNADTIVALGLAVQLNPKRCRPRAIERAIDEVDEPVFRDRVIAMRERIAATHSFEATIDAIERLFAR